jgi:hypothetical protein
MGRERVAGGPRRWTITAAAPPINKKKNNGDDEHFIATLAGDSFGKESPCWLPLLNAFNAEGGSVCWVQGDLEFLDPPDHQCHLMVMETETDIVRAELAWLKDRTRILQAVGGYGGRVQD